VIGEHDAAPIDGGLVGAGRLESYEGFDEREHLVEMRFAVAKEIMHGGGL